MLTKATDVCRKAKHRSMHDASIRSHCMQRTYAGASLGDLTGRCGERVRGNRDHQIAQRDGLRERRAADSPVRDGGLESLARGDGEGRGRDGGARRHDGGLAAPQAARIALEERHVRDKVARELQSRRRARTVVLDSDGLHDAAAAPHRRLCVCAF